jgi:hypothetical protein
VPGSGTLDAFVVGALTVNLSCGSYTFADADTTAATAQRLAIVISSFFIALSSRPILSHQRPAGSYHKCKHRAAGT